MRKNRQVLLWAGPLVVVALSSAGVLNSARAAHDGSAGARSEEPIRALLTQMTEAYNRGDARGVSAAFAPDSELITGDGTVVRGPAEIEKFFSELQTKLPKGTHFIATVMNVRFAGPEVAVLTSEGGWLMPGEPAISDKNQGIQSLVALRSQGTWRVVLFQRTRRVPVAAATR